MKFNCGPTREEKNAAYDAEQKRLQDWHDFYAIIPRQVGSHDCRCFEVIERKGYKFKIRTIHGFLSDKWEWEYRAKGGQG